MNCSRIRELIDESERPDSLPYYVVRHTTLCAECNKFAEERLRLKELLALPGRVTAPANFEAVLSARLAERAARKSFSTTPSSWLSPVGYLRLGGAAVALLAIFIIAHHTFNNDVQTDNKAKGRSATENVSAPPPAPGPGDSGTAKRDGRGDGLAVEPAHDLSVIRHVGTSRGSRRHMASLGEEPDLETSEGAVLVIRGPDLEVGVPAISVGAQPLYYNASYARSARTSF